MDQNKIRNFCIIAHIDHGKSTLADRMIEYTGTVNEYNMQNQVLDNMSLEREKGITIKSHAIKMDYKYKDNTEYCLNLIDTPGHVDFTYEVSRSLAACEGTILVVDAAQGIEAQTLSNLYLAMDNDLTIIPVLNKVDLPSADVETVSKAIRDLLGGDTKIYHVSAKTGLGVKELLEKVVEEIPPPSGNPDAPARALIFDSIYDTYRGVISLVRMVDGSINKGDKIHFHKTKQDYLADEIGHLRLERSPSKTLQCGEVGYVIGSIKQIADVKIGDTIMLASEPDTKPLKGYKEILPMVFCGLYPVNPEDYNNLRESLEKLKLNDSSITWEPETSTALGFGFRAGFLGLLHMEIVQERLDREFNVDIITTVPNVQYIVVQKDGTELFLESPSNLPDLMKIDYIKEPFISASIIVPKAFVGNIMKLSEEKRGIQVGMEYLDTSKINIKYEFPLSETVIDFYDKLKSVTKGYASFDYEFKDYRRSELVKLDILLNTEPVDAFSVIIHKSKSYTWGCSLTTKLKELIPRQMFETSIQAAIGAKIISRTTVKAFRKNVTAKCYGGDISRKRKLLEKQKAGKKRMKQVGSVEIPQAAFLAVLKMD